MSFDLTQVQLVDEHPIHDQLAREWAFLMAETQPLPLVESREIRSHRRPHTALRHRLLNWLASLNPVDILIFGVMASAYTAIVLGLVWAGRS